jgi:hypothetical protein
MASAVALDPNVIIASGYDTESAKLISDLWEKHRYDKPGRIFFATDTGKELRAAYVATRDSLRARGDSKRLETKNIEELLDKWEKWTRGRDNGLDGDITAWLRINGCTSATELQLVALGASDGVFACAVGKDGICDEVVEGRPVLHDRCKLLKLRKLHLPGLEVRYSSSGEALAHLEYSYLSRLFEHKVAGWVQKQFDYHPALVKVGYTPLSVKEENAGDIDVYAEDVTSTLRRVLVCECKLRLPTSRSIREIEAGEVDQLIRKVKAVNRFETAQGAKEGFRAKIFGILVSNAKSAHPDALERAKGEKNKIEIWAAALPPDWDKHSEWALKRCERIRRPKKTSD